MNDTPTSTYSITQGGNLAVIAAAIALVLSHPDFTNQANVEVLLTALVIAVGAAVSWYGRWRKGDLTLGGFRKPQA